MRRWKCEIKEKNNDHILTPELWGDDYCDESYCVNWWGLNNSDVEWYKLTEIKDDTDTKDL